MKRISDTIKGSGERIIFGRGFDQLKLGRGSKYRDESSGIPIQKKMKFLSCKVGMLC